MEAFCRTPDAEKKLTPALRGVLVELAATGIVRSAESCVFLAFAARYNYSLKLKCPSSFA